MAQKENTNLIRIMCHDINNHLYLASMSVMLLKKNLFKRVTLEDDVKQKLIKHLDMADLAHKSQSELIASVNSMQSLSDQKVNVELVPVDLGSCIDASLSLLQKRINDKGLVIEKVYSTRIIYRCR